MRWKVVEAMPTFNAEELTAFAKKYIWWKTPEDAIRYPRRVVAQVMNIGDWKDVVALERMVGPDYLREVIAHAEIGQFNARSWHFWHYRLGLAELNHVPPMPVRRIA